MKEYKLPQVLTQLMKQQDISDFELSYEVGISESTIWSYRKDKRKPTMFTCMDLAEYFGVSLDYLVYGRSNE